ncbi:MAG: hypothetical protein GF398_11130 [Chitinivibrionales bacterium]|nr:hypothetical protein [Chitinivibrionales bacterium]
MRHHRYLHPALSYLIWSVVIPLCMGCTRQSNPFSEIERAQVHIISTSFADTDTLSIFSTETLTVVATARDHIDSIRIHLPGNRLDADHDSIPDARSVLRSPISADAYSFFFSFWNTGRKALSIETFRSNETVETKSIILQVASPLGQEPIEANTRGTVILSTPPVQDNGVWYHWQIGNRHFSSLSSSHTVQLTDDVIHQQTGYLWVSDFDERFSSPKASFEFAVSDTVGPQFELVGAHGDTLRTGAPSFAVLCNIVDEQSGVISAATVNGDMLDALFAPYYRYDADLAGMQHGDILQLDVYAADFYGNATRDTFWLEYDSTAGAQSGFFMAVIEPSTAHSVSGGREFTLHARLTELLRTGIDAQISVMLNDSQHTPVSIDTTAKELFWNYPLVLKDGINELLLQTVDAWVGATDTVALTIKLDETRNDTTPPVIAEIALDSTIVFGYRAVIRHPNPALAIIAFDDASDIQTVTASGMLLQQGSGENRFVWSGNLDLRHAIQGDTLLITATDNSGNAKSTQLIVYVNRPPYLDTILGLPSILYINERYQGRFLFKDDDGDTIQFSTPALPDELVLTGSEFYFIPRNVHNPVPFEIQFRLFDGIDSSDVGLAITTYRQPHHPCSLATYSAKNLKSGDTLYLEKAKGVDTISVRIFDEDPLITEKYSILVSYNGTFTYLPSQDIDTNVYDIIVDPAAAQGIDSLSIVVADKSGSMATDKIYLQYQSPNATDAIKVYYNIDTSLQRLSEPLYNFPLVVKLDRSNHSFRQTSTDPYIEVKKSDGTPTPFELERWDGIAEKAEVWALIDTLNNDTNRSYFTIDIDYGRRPRYEGNGEVFQSDNGFAGVWHLDESGDGASQKPDLMDASGNGNHGIDFVQEDHVETAVGLGLRFGGEANRDYIEIPDAPTLDLDTMTISCWARIDKLIGGGSYITKPVQPSNRYNYRLYVDESSTPLFKCHNGGFVGANRQIRDTIHHLAASYDGDRLRFYVDGKLTDIEDYVLTPLQSEFPLYLGAGFENGNLHTFLRGEMDEVRVEHVARSRNWLRICYESQKPGSTFLRIE